MDVELAHNEYSREPSSELKHRDVKIPRPEDPAKATVTDHHIPHDELVSGQPELLWTRIRKVLRDPFSEFLGTMVLVLFGDGANAQVVLGQGAKGDWGNVNWGWAVGVMMGVYCGGTSGAHLNPAVTLANCIFRGFSWRKLPVYIIAQTLGAMVACLIVYGNNTSAIDLFEGGAGIRTVGLATSTGGIFASYPLDFLTKGGQFYDEFVGTALLLFCLYALLDDGNIGAGNLTPLGLFIIVYGIGSSFGSNTCYAINPARDFGPRLMTYALGYGSDVWTAGDYYFWVPIVAPLLGAVFGGFLYDTFVYTGKSPINTPFMGIPRIFKVMRMIPNNRT